MADNYIGRVTIDGNAPAAPVSVQPIVNGAPVSATNPQPTTTAITFPSALTTTDSGVRRMQPLTWEAGASVSNMVGLGNRERVSSLLIPASGWAATATRIYFDISDDGTTWYPARDLAGNLIYAQVGASAASYGIGLSDEERARISRKFVRMKSATDAAAPVTQAAAVSCVLGSMNAGTVNPYSTWSFRVAAGGSINAEVISAGRVTWAVSDGTGTTTTISSALVLTTIAKTVDVVCTAAFAYEGSYINVNSSIYLTFKLLDLPNNLERLRLSNTPLVTGALNDLSKVLTSLTLSNTPLVTGALNDLSKVLTYLYLSTPLVTGALNDLSKVLTYLYLSTPLVTGALNDLSKVLTSLTLSNTPLVTGALNDLSKVLTSLTLYNTPLVTGALNDLSKVLTSLTLSNTPLVTGALNDLSKVLTYLYLSTPLVTGALNDLSKVLTYLYLSTPLVTGALNDLSKVLTSLTLSNTPLVTGALNDLSKVLTYLYLSTPLVTGALNDLSKVLTYLYLSTPLVTGALNDLSKVLTTLYLYNTPLVTGALSTDLPTALTVELRLVGLTLVTGSFTATQVPASNKAVRCYDCGFSPTDTDNMIITLESVGSSNGVAVFETNRTAASDAALTALQGRGWTVTFA